MMISKIISRAACLTELTSNPKSFSNCPDLHGGVPLEENGDRGQIYAFDIGALGVSAIESARHKFCGRRGDRGYSFSQATRLPLQQPAHLCIVSGYRAWFNLSVNSQASGK